MIDQKKVKETRERKNGLVYKEKGFKIKVDSLNYILTHTGYTETYYISLAHAFEEIYERKLKENLVGAEDKTFKGIQKTIEKTKKWLDRRLKVLSGVRVNI